MTEPDDLEARIKSSLQQSAAQLDADSKNRLGEIRRKALRHKPLQAPAHSRWLSRNYWLPAAGLALCSVFAMLIAFPYLHTNHPAADQTAMLDLIENSDELDALSDPGFYMWMDEFEEAKNAANAA